MREIKFRGWLPQLKRMTYCHTLKQLMSWNIRPESIDATIWLQYTGLKDKNGKEIYEGDIVACGDGEVPTLIEWHDESHSYLAYNLKRKEYHSLDKYFIRFIGAVIGNIHENPELVEGLGNG